MDIDAWKNIPILILVCWDMSKNPIICIVKCFTSGKKWGESQFLFLRHLIRFSFCNFTFCWCLLCFFFFAGLEWGQAWAKVLTRLSSQRQSSRHWQLLPVNSAIPKYKSRLVIISRTFVDSTKFNWNNPLWPHSLIVSERSGSPRSFFYPVF